MFAGKTCSHSNFLHRCTNTYGCVNKDGCTNTYGCINKDGCIQAYVTRASLLWWLINRILTRIISITATFLASGSESCLPSFTRASTLISHAYVSCITAMASSVTNHDPASASQTRTHAQCSGVSKCTLVSDGQGCVHTFFACLNKENPTFYTCL